MDYSTFITTYQTICYYVEEGIYCDKKTHFGCNSKLESIQKEYVTQAIHESIPEELYVNSHKEITKFLEDNHTQWECYNLETPPLNYIIDEFYYLTKELAIKIRNVKRTYKDTKWDNLRKLTNGIDKKYQNRIPGHNWRLGKLFKVAPVSTVNPKYVLTSEAVDLATRIYFDMIRHGVTNE